MQTTEHTLCQTLTELGCTNAIMQPPSRNEYRFEAYCTVNSIDALAKLASIVKTPNTQRPDPVVQLVGVEGDGVRIRIISRSWTAGKVAKRLHAATIGNRAEATKAGN
jgi:hypothetical protein